MSKRVEGSPSEWARVASSLQVVECELNTDCNRSCSYCPQSFDLLPSAPKLMSEEVLALLLDDLARVDFHGRFSHHLYGEPLLNPVLIQQVKRIQSTVPRAVQVLFSNGDLLTEEAHRSLLEAGISLFAVTRHQVGAYPERRQQVVQYARELQFTSRGGAVEFILKKKRRLLGDIQKQACHAPDEMLIVGWDGRILRCYEDARREGSLGDLRTHSLAAIWAQSEVLRSALRRGARGEAGEPCSGCDNLNHVATGQSVATEPFWQTSSEAAPARALLAPRL